MELLQRSAALLELPAVLSALAECAVSDRAKELCLELKPAESFFEAELLQAQTADAVMLSGLYGSPSFSGLTDVTEAVKRAEMGGTLNLPELIRVGALLRAARLTKSYTENRRQEAGTSLDQFFSGLLGNKFLEDRITESIINEEELADTASSELYDIRRKIRQAATKARDILTRITTSQTYQKYLQDSIITMRDGRYVVPVKAEHRGVIKGLVHDISSSGATVFVEPAAVVEQNNVVRLLQAQEKKEIERILAEFSAEVAQFAGTIYRDYDILCALDVIFARAKLAYRMKANRPEMVEKGETRLIRARHPLLPMDKAVPIDFNIGGKNSAVIITGPNTGGKTVSIKTLGLLCLMAKCGLQIPAAPGSRVRVFGQVLADIGDEQSIEQNLSTFSSHMTNIVAILEEAGPGSLVLLDELGAGTDPAEGAALAVAIIDQLRSQGSSVAATTHYAELKVYALRTHGVENASCEFDVESLRPTYRLIFGVPGRSNAFAISRRLGLPEFIIKKADEGIGEQERHMEEVITGLDEKRQSLEHRLEEAERRQREAEKAAKDARENLETVEAKREKLMEEAKKKAAEIIENARAAGEKALSEARKIKQDAADGVDVNIAAARAVLRGQMNAAASDVATQQIPRKAEPLPRPLVAGDHVLIVSTNMKAEVVEAPVGDMPVKLKAGILNITVSQSDLTLLNEKPKEKKKPQVTVTPGGRPEGAASLDIRGITGAEAEMELDRFIDNACRLNLNEVTIIHGKGTGALRKAVQAHLRTMKQVRSFRAGTFGEGEMGVTIVTLR